MLEDYRSLGSPLFVFEPRNGVEPFSHDYKSSVIPIYQGGVYSINICMCYPDEMLKTVKKHIPSVNEC